MRIAVRLSYFEDELICLRYTIPYNNPCLSKIMQLPIFSWNAFIKTFEYWSFYLPLFLQNCIWDKFKGCLPQIPLGPFLNTLSHFVFLFQSGKKINYLIYLVVTNTQPYILVHSVPPFLYMHTQNNSLWKKRNKYKSIFYLYVKE